MPLPTLSAVNYKEEIGRRLKDARESKGLSLEELSRRTKPRLLKSRIGNYERGIRTPGPMEANTLAEALNMDAAYLMGLQQSMNKQELDLLRNFRALPENERSDYARRIGVLALAYREPVPDERMGPGWTKPKPKVRK